MVDKVQNKSRSKVVKGRLTQVPSSSQDSTVFLLAEYERLQSVRAEVSQIASRRFEFYLTITSAAIGAFLVLGRTQNTTLPSHSWFDVIALGFLVYGLITFLNLAYASGANRDLIVAIQSIQDYFIGKDPVIRDYLYFRSYTEPKHKYRFSRILFRGIGGGSEKAVISLLNSSLLTYLVNSLLVVYLQIQIPGGVLQTTLISVFLLSGLAHAFVVNLIYRYYRL